jgi:hypothetical protein
VVAVEHLRLHPGEQRDVAVHVTPARLHHAHVGVDEVPHDVAQEARLRDEVGVEDGQHLALGHLEPGVERARLVAHAIDAVDVDGVDALRLQLLHLGARDGLRLVGRVVEDLDLELVERVVRLGDGLDESRGDGRLVEERQLDGRRRELVVGQRDRVASGLPDLRAVLPAQDHQVEAVEAVCAESQENCEIGDAEEQVEHRVRHE